MKSKHWMILGAVVLVVNLMAVGAWCCCRKCNQKRIIVDALED